MRLFKSDEDLFRESTMTFGQHLDELRVCLWKSVLGLAVCFIIGLFVGAWVVDFIQQPLTDAMIDYYRSQSEATVKAHVDELKKLGYPQDIVDRVTTDSLLPEVVYLNPNELRHQLGVPLPNASSSPERPAKDPGDGVRDETFQRVYLWRPIANDPRVRTTSLSVYEPFSIYVKAAVLVGAVLSSPWVFWQIWAFVAAGLYRNERKYIHIFLPFSLGLFLAGAAMAFFFVFKPILQFLLSVNSWLGIDPTPRISEWLSFALLMPLGFGVAFQLPLVMLFLERIGVFDVAAYISKWRIAVLVIFVCAMPLTPSPDPWSMLMLAAPMTGLYFAGILLCKLMPRRKSPYAEVASH